MRCRYENETIRALQSGALSESLIEHQKSCADCRDAVKVAQALRRDAGDLAARYAPPPSAAIWAATERHKRMTALARATRFLRVMKAAGLIYAAVLVAWVLYSLAGHDGVAEDRRKLLAFGRDLLNSDYAGHRLTFQLFAQSPPFAQLAAVYRNFDWDGPLGLVKAAADLSDKIK